MRATTSPSVLLAVPRAVPRAVALAAHVAAALAALVALVACEPPAVDEPWPTSEGLAACPDALLDGSGTCNTFRALTGASMGGGAAARIAFKHPELFDSVGIMGTPLADLPALWHMLKENQLGGFCDSATIAAGVAAQGAAFLSSEESFCGAHDVALDDYPADFAQVSPSDFATPDGKCAAFRSDFNHWYRGPEAGRGSPFERSYLIDVFYDLLAAYGNPLTGDGRFLATGLDAEWRVTPSATVLPRACVMQGAAVPSLAGVKSREHNPDGTHAAIPFCDGSAELTGDWRANDTHDKPIGFALAIDVDGDGQRDLGEPIVANDRERFTDSDGDREHDNDEPFDDDGIDGVPGTADFGEGNGVFDESPGLARWRAQSPSTLYAAMSDAQVNRLSVWMDAGVRDFLNSAQVSNRLFDVMKARAPSSSFHQGFKTLPGAIEGSSYDTSLLDTGALAHVSYLQYGNPDLCPASDPFQGDGNHVGPDVIDRIVTLLTVSAARMPEGDRRTAIGGDIADLESPTGTLSDFAFLDSFESQVLGRALDFGVLLPPDYFVESEEERRYPVIYFLHGQGNSAEELVGLGIVMWGGMKESARNDRKIEGITDMQRAILVFPDGQCLGDECFTGTFYADFADVPGAARAPKFESALYELMRTVEERYRTLAPVTSTER